MNRDIYREMMHWLSPVTIGFDSVLNDLRKLTDNVKTGYPPYNIIKKLDKTTIQIALAGFSKEEIEVFTEGDILTISTVEKEEKSDFLEYSHHGIAKRNFSLSFALGKNFNINDNDVVFKNGLLTITIRKFEQKCSKHVIPIS